MKKDNFQMRISEETRMQIEMLHKYYKMSRSSAICMLIAKEAARIEDDNII